MAEAHQDEIAQAGAEQLREELGREHDRLLRALADFDNYRRRAEREAAIERLERALDEYEVVGITTTLPFFREVIKDEEFVSGHLDTGFITRFNERRAAAANAARVCCNATGRYGRPSADRSRPPRFVNWLPPPMPRRRSMREPNSRCSSVSRNSRTGRRRC